MTLTIQPTDSLYLARFKRYVADQKNNYDKVGESYLTRYVNHSHKPHLVKVSLTNMTINETEYKGHSIIVIGWERFYQDVYDLNDNFFDKWGDTPTDAEIGRLGAPIPAPYFLAYCWEIGTSFDSVANLRWGSDGAVFSGVFHSSRELETLKKAKKRIDIRALLVAVRDQLIQDCNTRLMRGDAVNPYNVDVGDHVFIQAHGRLRKGMIVGTTGSRFIVGYVTPSNHDEVKYKTLRQVELWVESGI